MFSGLHPPAADRGGRQSPRMSLPSRVLGRSGTTQNATVNNSNNVNAADLEMFQAPLTSDDNCQQDPCSIATAGGTALETTPSSLLTPQEGGQPNSTPLKCLEQCDGSEHTAENANRTITDGSPTATLSPSPPCAPRSGGNPKKHIRDRQPPGGGSTNEILVSPPMSLPLVTAVVDTPRSPSPQIAPLRRNLLLEEAMSSPLYVEGPREGGITAVDLWVLQNSDMLRVDARDGDGGNGGNADGASEESNKISAWVTSLTAMTTVIHSSCGGSRGNAAMDHIDTVESGVNQLTQPTPPRAQHKKESELSAESLKQFSHDCKEDPHGVLQWMKQAAVYHALFVTTQ